jgi:hypothetical protein
MPVDIYLKMSIIKVRSSVEPLIILPGLHIGIYRKGADTNIFRYPASD